MPFAVAGSTGDGSVRRVTGPATERQRGTERQEYAQD